MTDAALDPVAEAAACRRLWAAVALLAIADAEAEPLGPAGAFLRSDDFRMIADLAGLDADAALQRIDGMRRERIAAARAAEDEELAAGRRPTAQGAALSVAKMQRDCHSEEPTGSENWAERIFNP